MQHQGSQQQGSAKSLINILGADNHNILSKETWRSRSCMIIIQETGANVPGMRMGKQAVFGQDLNLDLLFLPYSLSFLVRWLSAFCLCTHIYLAKIFLGYIKLLIEKKHEARLIGSFIFASLCISSQQLY